MNILIPRLNPPGNHLTSTDAQSTKEPAARYCYEVTLTHALNKPFVCCLKPLRFRWQEHLKRHLRGRHTNEKPFVCTECGEKCSRPDNLLQYIHTHSSETEPAIIRNEDVALRPTRSQRVCKRYSSSRTYGQGLCSARCVKPKFDPCRTKPPAVSRPDQGASRKPPAASHKNPTKPGILQRRLCAGVPKPSNMVSSRNPSARDANPVAGPLSPRRPFSGSTQPTEGSEDHLPPVREVRGEHDDGIDYRRSHACTYEPVSLMALRRPEHPTRSLRFRQGRRQRRPCPISLDCSGHGGPRRKEAEGSLDVPSPRATGRDKGPPRVLRADLHQP